MCTNVTMPIASQWAVSITTLRASASPRSASSATIRGVIGSPVRWRRASELASLGSERVGLRGERPRRRIGIRFERAALAERILPGILGGIHEDVAALAAATVRAFDQRVARR